MGASKNFIKGIKSPPPPIEKRGPKRKESIRKAPTWQNTPEEKNIAEKHPPPPIRRK